MEGFAAIAAQGLLKTHAHGHGAHPDSPLGDARRSERAVRGTEDGAGPGREHRAAWRRALVRVGLLILILVLLAAGAQVLGPWSPERLRRLVVAFGALAPAAYVGLFVVLNSAGVPSPLLGAAGGFALGLPSGALATLAGMTVAACAQLLLARRLTGRRGAPLLPLARRIQDALERPGWLAVVTLRLVPAPFSELNLAAGLTSLPLRAMAIGTLIGGAPKALAWAALGAARVPALPPVVTAAFVATGLALTIAVWRWRVGRSTRARSEPSPPETDESLDTEWRPAPGRQPESHFQCARRYR